MTNDLISRDNFINSIVCSVSSPCETKREQRDAQFKQKYTVDAFIKELKRAPAVDAVEVVRCENCEHCELYVDYLTGKTFNFGYCYRRFKRRKSINRVNSDDYCSYGERRESEVT